jgi:hypothetical protein
LRIFSFTQKRSKRNFPLNLKHLSESIRKCSLFSKREIQSKTSLSTAVNQS